MIGDGHVFVAESRTSLHHRLNRIASVTPLAMHVQVATDVVARNQLRQGAAIRRHEFRTIVAQLRWNERQPDRLVERFFGVKVDRSAISIAQSSGRQRQPLRSGTRAKFVDVSN